MNVEVKLLRHLFRALAARSGKSLDRQGLIDIGELMQDPNPLYLYKNLWVKMQAGSATTIPVQEYKLNLILGYLGFQSLEEFRQQTEHPLTAQQISLVGNYYSYLRVNHQHQSQVLRSPATVRELHNTLVLEMKGKDRVFRGEITIREGCIFVYLKSGEGKCFHHVYKVGQRHRPIVMQGVFSGVTTAFDPIAGRALLIRQDVGIENLTNLKQDTAQMIASENEEERRVGSYFRDYNNNNVSPSKSYDFGYDDLIPS